MKYWLVVFILISSLSFAQSGQELQLALDKVQTLQANFEQVYTNKNFGEGVKYFGEFFLKKPGKIRWDYKKPEKKVITTDGQTFWLYKAADKQVYVNPSFDKERKNVGISFLWGDQKLNEAFEVKFLKEEHGLLLFDLLPRKEIENVQKLTIWANKSDYNIEKVSLLEAGGNTNLLIFRNLKFNKPIKDKNFVFIPPKGTEIILPANSKKQVN
jgi:outer membrane lipoprotein carrier protein